MDVDELNKAQRCSFRYGRGWFPNTWPDGKDGTESEVRQQAWRVHGRQFVEEWIVEHPGTRPAAWWDYDAPEPFGDQFSCEQTYLMHHGLLTDAERTALKALRAAGKSRPVGRYEIRTNPPVHFAWPADLKL